MAVIVHVSSFTVGAKGGFQHNTAIKLSNGLVRNGHLVLNFGDRDVARAGSILGSRRFGRGRANATLLAFSRLHRPDLLLLGHADIIDAETVAEIRAAVPGLKVLQWNVDPLFEPENVAKIESKLGVVDATLVSTGPAALGPLRRGGRRVGFLPNAVDPSIERGRVDLVADPPFDFFYAVGNPDRPKRWICGREWNMTAFMTMLVEALPGLRPRLAGVLGHPRLEGADFQAALEQAALGLNISRRADEPLYSSDRLAQMVGNGMAAVIERGTGYGEIFGDDEMVFFESLDELIGKLGDLARDPVRRQALAGAGRARYLALFNERLVARYLMDYAFERADPAAYGWPASLIRE
jgi:hypothetical protein